MSSPFVAEIRIFAGNFAITGWAMCNGQLMPISQNTALFSLLGTQYGGDGKATFALPNLQDATPMHWGQGAGLSERFIGESAGEETLTLLTTEMPIHTHSVQVANANADDNDPADKVLAKPARAGALYSSSASPIVQGDPQAVSVSGGSLPHNNRQPYLVLTFLIALQGVFPPRQ